MVVPRWKKVIADFWGNKVRTILVTLSIAIGVFAVGFVTSTYMILQTDVPTDFQSANPHVAVIYTDSFDEDLLSTIRKLSGIAAAEGRGTVAARLRSADGSTYPLQIISIPNINDIQIDKLRLEQGSPTLRSREVYLERQEASKLGYKTGDTIQFLLADGTRRDLSIAGIVQDVTGGSFIFSGQASAYTDPRTLVWLGGSALNNQLLFTTSKNGHDETDVSDVAENINRKLEQSGLQVYATLINQTGQHPSQQILNALLALLGGLGILSVFLSTFLVVNTISGLMSQQVRQIGVMKAIGASMGQITGIYLVLVLAFGISALILAIPTAAVASYSMCTLLARAMNINLAPFRVPVASILIQIGIGLGIPVLGALVPILSAARMTVRSAISSYGLSSVGRRGWFDRLLETIRGLPRPLLLSIRNTFRRKGRLLLTLSTLILGGAIFISVFGVQELIYLALDKTFGYTLADVNVNFSRPYRLERLQAAVEGVEGVRSMEGWTFESAQILREDGETGEDVQLIALPGQSKLIIPAMTSGRWLVPEDQNALVVGNHYIKIRPETQVGDVVQIQIGEKEFPFTIIGIYEMAGSPNVPMVFTNFEYLSRLTNKIGQASSLRIVTDRSDPARQTEVMRALESRFKELGMQANLQTGSDTNSQQSAPVKILIYLLLAMVALISTVGGLGLTGTMSMNVLERRREIGVMRSIGAEDQAIFQLVVVEGTLIGLISWAFGALVSIPIARLLNRAVGVAMLNVPLKFVFSFQGLWLWLIVVLILASLASLIPARSAVRLTVHDVLAYE